MRSLFEHRRGFCFAALYIGFILLLNFITEKAKPFLLIGAALLLLLFFPLKRKARLIKRLLFFLLAFSLAVLPSLTYDFSDSRVEECIEKECAITFTVYDVRSVSKSRASVYAVINEVDGRQASVKATVSLPDPSIKEGDVIFGTATVKDLDEESTYLLSHGYRYALTLAEAKKVGEAKNARVFGTQMREELALLIERRVGGEEAGLLSALLLGEREDVSAAFSADMSRLGTSHMLALSGLHLSVLLLGIERLLKRIGTNKGWRYGAVALLTVLYLILTGFPSSAMRAGVMLLFVFLSFFLKRDYDPITSLGYSVALICTLQPYSVTDMSLWLSAFATFGILLYLARTEQNLIETKEATLKSRLLSYLSDSVKITLSASLATLPLTAYMFGTLPLLFVLANLLFAPLMQALITGAVLVLLLGWVPFVSSATAFIARLLISSAAYLSSLPYSQISLREPFVLTVLLTTVVLLFLYFGFSPRRAFSMKAPACFLFCAAILIGGFYAARTIGGSGFAAVEYASLEEGSDYFILRHGAKTAVIDCTEGTSSNFSEIEAAVFSYGACDIDSYVFTYYPNDLEESGRDMIAKSAVHRICLPSPKTDKEQAVARLLLETARKHHVSISYYEKGLPFSVCGVDFTLYLNDPPESPIKRICFTAKTENESFAYISRGSVSPERFQEIKAAIADADTVFFGTFGKRINYTYETPSALTQARICTTDKKALPFSRYHGVLIAERHSLRLKK